MRRFAPLTILGLVLAACANEPTVNPGSGDPEPQLDQTRLGIYEAMVREVVGAEDLGWKRIVIVSRLCENAAAADEPKGCDDSFSAAEREELIGRLGDLDAPVEFMADPTPLYDDEWFQGVPDTIVIRLGTIAPHGAGVEVGGSYGCGGLCGSGTTYLLEETADGWKVVGTDGSMWIA